MNVCLYVHWCIRAHPILSLLGKHTMNRYVCVCDVHVQAHKHKYTHCMCFVQLARVSTSLWRLSAINALASLVYLNFVA